jgi:hypothetical protein
LISSAQLSQSQLQRKVVSLLNELTEKNAEGSVCFKVTSMSGPLTSRSGWQYRKVSGEDSSMKADFLISEEKVIQLTGGRSFDGKNPIFCYGSVKSNGLDNGGKLTLFLNNVLPQIETAKALYFLVNQLSEVRQKSYDRMEKEETVYQLSAREIHSLIQLINLWLKEEGKPQHYDKWCQMHQIVATNLFYMGLVSRVGAMTGDYYPTKRALEFFAGELAIPKRRVFVRDKEGRHKLVDEGGEAKTISDYLEDYTNRETAIEEYKQALKSFHNKVKSQGASEFYSSVPDSADFSSYFYLGD